MKISQGAYMTDLDKIEKLGTVIRETHYIPGYQREYSWESSDSESKEVEVTIFWKDLVTFYQNKLESPTAKYLLGPIIVHTDGEKSYIIDGQQRLTTTIILLNVINKYCLELALDNNKIVCQNAFNLSSQEIVPFIGSISDDPQDDTIKLIVSPKNQSFFRDFIYGTKQFEDDGKNPAITNMHDAYVKLNRNVRTFIEKMSDWNSQR